MTTKMNNGSPESTNDFLAGRGILAGTLAFILFSVYIFSVSLVPVRTDNDCWWHVKSGWYITNFGLPEHDVFSYTAADYEWHNHEWITQVIFYQAFAAGEATGLGGWRGVILFKTIVLWACYALVFLLAGRLTKNHWIALLMVALAIAIGRRTFYPRPPVVSNLLLIIQIYLLVGICEGWFRQWWAFVLVPMIALWTNLHGAWMAGGVILAAFAADAVYTHFRDRLPKTTLAAPPTPFPLKLLFILLPLCLIATLLNPYGYRLYELPARVLSNRALVSAIGELQPPNFYYVIDFEMALHFGFFVALLLSRFRPRLFEILIYLFFLHQAIQHVRHMFLFSVMMVPLYARLLGAAVYGAREALSQWKPAERSPILLKAPSILAGVAALYVMQWVIINPREGGRLSQIFNTKAPAASYPQRNLQYLAGDGYIRQRFPAVACDFVELAELEGNMFNQNHYAGYLIWRLSPDKHLVFSDPRFDIFGGDIWADEEAIATGAMRPVLDGKPLWQALLDEYQVQWLFNRTTTVLTVRLHDSDEWVLAADWPDGWQIWIRNTFENAAMMERARRAAPLAAATTDIPAPNG